MPLTNFRLRQMERESFKITLNDDMNVLAGQLIAITDDGYFLGDNTKFDTTQGIVIAAEDSNPLTKEVMVIASGIMQFQEATHDLGDKLYVGRNGEVLLTAPTEEGSWVKEIGVVIDKGHWRFDPTSSFAIKNSGITSGETEDLPEPFATIQGTMNTMTTLLENTKSETDTLKTTIDSFKNDLNSDATYSEITKNSQAITAIVTKLGGNTDDGTSFKQISALQQKADSLTSMVGTITSTITGSDAYQAIATNVSSLQQTSNDLTSKVGSMETLVDDQGKSIGTLKTNVSELQQTSTSLTSRIGSTEALAATQGSDIGTLKTDVSTLQQSATSLTSRISSTEAGISGLQTITDSQGTDIGTLQTNVNGLQTTAGTQGNDISTLKTNVSTLQQTANSLSSQISSTTSSVNSQGTTLGTLQSNISALQQTATDLSSRISSVEATGGGDTAEAIGALQTDVSELQQTATSLTSRISATETKATSQDTSISVIQTNVSTLKQRADGFDTSVSTINDQLTTQASSIAQNANSISSVVTALNTTDPSTSTYTAIKQLSDSLSLKVSSADITTEISASLSGITLSGPQVHITGDTVIDGDIILSGNIRDGSITSNKVADGAISASKLAAAAIELTGALSVVGGSVTLDQNGLKVANSSTGSYNLLNAEGMNFYDANNNKFVGIGRYMCGTANHGQRVTFVSPWDKTPSVLVVPNTIQTNVSGYNTSDVQIVCNAVNITNSGFTVQVYTVLKSGASGIVPINKTVLNNVKPAYPTTISNGTKVTQSLTVPITATTASFIISASCSNYSYRCGNSNNEYYQDSQVAYSVNVYINGTLSQTAAIISQTASSFSTQKQVDISFSEGAAITLEFVVFNNSYRQSGYVTSSLVQAQYNTTSDQILSTGSAAFICTDADNAQYTLS